MNKKGFISTSVVLVLFLVFLFLLLSLLSLYSSNRRLLNKEKEDIKNNLILKDDENILLINYMEFTLIEYKDGTITASYNGSVESDINYSDWYNRNIGFEGGYAYWDNTLKIKIYGVILSGNGTKNDPFIIAGDQNET